MINDNERVFLTPKEVATVVRMDVQTVYRHIKGRSLVATKLGSRWKISTDALRDWLSGTDDEGQNDHG